MSDGGLRETALRYRDAVVEVSSEFILLGEGVTVPPALAAGQRADIILQGNGVMLRGGYILTPAHLVLAPPSISSTVNRYPLSDNTVLGTMKDQMIRATRILVTVHNVSGSGRSFQYEASLLGVDGAGDAAILFINPLLPWNTSNPVVPCCHPHFTFGSSRKCFPGDTITILGRDQLTTGTLVSATYNDGDRLAETVLVTSPTTCFTSGLPLLNCRGRLIGIQTFISGDRVGGPSQFFLRDVVKALLSRTKADSVADPAGDYLRYRKGYLGLGYQTFSGTNYDFSRSASGMPQILLDDTGALLPGPACKEVRGIKVVALAGGTGTSWSIPGGTGMGPLPSLPLSPATGLLQGEDQILFFNQVPVGTGGCQAAPALASWRTEPGDSVTITYRRPGPTYGVPATATVTMGFFPALLDYPWYAVGVFPSLTEQPYPGFSFPTSQTTYSQVPTETTSAPFRPSM